jgi:adenosylmethionine---8-amino-7-oxononanoate aminotransferase
MQSLLDKDKEFIWHPFSPLKTSSPTIAITRGEGIYLVDEKNNRYIDAISSWWVNLHGHAHPYIAERIYAQAMTLEQVIFAGFTHPPAVELAEKLIELLQHNFSKVFYSDNGSTAVEVAVKMAIQYWWNTGGKDSQRKKIIAFHNSYHGDTFGSMSVSGRSIFTEPFHDRLFDVEFIDLPDEKNIETLKAHISSISDQAVAFIYEPLLQAAGGMIMYDAWCMDQLLGCCKANHLICIADEVMTGFGRTGKLFASDYMENKPDIICLSKGLTGGTMALGVTACNRKIVAAFDTDDRLKTFFHGHSFTANPLACAASLASMELLKKESCLTHIEYIAACHQVFCERLQSVNIIRHARSIGTVVAFEIASGNDGYLNTISAETTAYLLKKGIYLRPLGNTVYLMPPYCITKEQLEEVYNALLEYLGTIS